MPQDQSTQNDNFSLDQFIQTVKIADVWGSHFQKFPFLKLILRLLTDITDQNYVRPTGYHQKILSVSNESYKPYSVEDEKAVDSIGTVGDDELLNCQHQINSILASDVRYVRRDQLLLKVRPPVISPDLDKLVTVLAAVAKVHVASIISASMAACESNNETSNKIEARHLYDALRKITHIKML